jgi:hypothetical protein
MPHGRVAEAACELERIVRLDPLSIPARFWLAVMLYFSRQPDRMAAEGERMLALDPNHFLSHWVIGIQSEAMGDGPWAVAAMERAHELSGGSPFTTGFLGFVYGRAGRHDGTRMLLERARSIAAKSYVPPSTFALCSQGLNEWDTAFEWWNRAIDGRDPLVMPVKNYPFFDPVRGDQRYRDMLHRMHLD